jgi:predicted dehydrogenase
MRKIGLVGLGKMGVLHGAIVNALPDCRISAVCEREKFIVNMAKKILLNDVSYYVSCTSMMENEALDAVFITTSIRQHLPIIVEIAKAQRDISLFVEKPLAESADSARLACETVANLRGVHMVGFQKRYSPIYRHAKKLIDEAAIGKPLFFMAHSYSSDLLREGKSWRSKKGTGGVLLDLAPHLIDLILWFFGDVKSVSAITRSLYSREVEDFANASLVFESGLTGQMNTCWSVRGFRLPEISIEIYGDKGNMLVEDDMVKLEPGESTMNQEPQVFYKQTFDTAVPFLVDQREYTEEDMTFLDCINRGSEPGTSFSEAAKVNLLIDRIKKTASGTI